MPHHEASGARDSLPSGTCKESEPSKTASGVATGAGSALSLEVGDAGLGLNDTNFLTGGDSTTATPNNSPSL